MRIRIVLIYVFAIGLCSVFQLKAQDPQPVGGHWEVFIIRGRLLPPPPDKPTTWITCLGILPDTCFTAYSWVPDTVAPKPGMGGEPAGIYINSEHRGYANVGTKIGGDYDKMIISIVRRKETIEVASPEEMLKYLLPPSP